MLLDSYDCGDFSESQRSSGVQLCVRQTAEPTTWQTDDAALHFKESIEATT